LLVSPPLGDTLLLLIAEQIILEVACSARIAEVGVVLRGAAIEVRAL